MLLINRRLWAGLFLVTCLTSLPVFTNGNLAVACQGENGAAGDPASDGKDGANGDDTVWRGTRSEAAETLNIWGQHGGLGGNGGNGVDGPDADSVAQGGNGGDGGDGSSIAAYLEVIAVLLTHRYTAGNGGHAGAGGNSVGLPDGLGGNGGNGGSINVNLSAQRFIDGLFHGGAGGIGIGLGQSGGDGGSVTANLSLRPRLNLGVSPYTQQIKNTLRAGEGGKGFQQAKGGNGGDAIISSAQYYRSNSSGFDSRNVAIAGSGGLSYGNDGGTGGNLSSFIPQIDIAVPAGDRQSFGLTNMVYAGHGGDSRLWYGHVGNGGHGGDAMVRAGGTAFRFAHGTNSITLAQTAGAGGKVDYNNNGYSSNLGNRGGNGGNVVMDQLKLRILPSNSVGSLNQFVIDTRAGYGGENLFGYGGHGGDALLANNYIHSDVSVNANISATGGYGGQGWLGGNGGNAEISNGFQYYGTDGDLTLALVASAGNAGLSDHRNLEIGEGPTGGNARIHNYVRLKGNLEILAYVNAGSAELGKSGDASIWLTGITEGDSNSELDGRSNNHFDQNVRIGSNVDVYIRSVAEQGAATASAISHGGRGYELPGYGKATSIATSIGGDATATSESDSAQAYVPRMPDLDRGRRAESTSQAAGRNAVASSTATARGKYSIARATSSAAGFLTSRSEVLATSGTGSQFTASVNLVVNVDGNGTPIISTALASDEAIYNALPNSSHARAATYLNSDISLLAGVEQTGLVHQYDFSDGNVDLYNVVDYTTGDAGFDYRSDFTFQNRLRLSGEEALHSNVYAFFYDLESIAGGANNLEILLTAGTDILLDQSFANGDDALTFLTDWSARVGYVELTTHASGNADFDLTVTSDTSVGQEFHFKLGVAGLDSMPSMLRLTAVPEPGSLWLLGTIVATSGLLVRRRS